MIADSSLVLHIWLLVWKASSERAGRTLGCVEVALFFHVDRPNDVRRARLQSVQEPKGSRNALFFFHVR
jgi:hypothetical protein